MKTVTIYSHNDDYAVEGVRAFARLSDAKRSARDTVDGGDQSEVRITRMRCQAPSLRELAAAIYNREGFVVEREDVATCRWEQSRDEYGELVDSGRVRWSKAEGGA